MELGALVEAPAWPAAHGLVAAVVAVVPIVLVVSAGWPPAAPSWRVQTGERRGERPASVWSALSPELPDSRVALAEWQLDGWDSIWPASSSDSWAPLVWFLLWDDLAELDLVCPPGEALSIAGRRVWSREDLPDYTEDVHIPGGRQEWEHGMRAADSASCLHSLAWHSTRLDADDTRRQAGDTVSPILPNTRGCSRRGVPPNSIPSRPIPTAGCS